MTRTTQFDTGFTVLAKDGAIQSFTTRLYGPAYYRQLSIENPATTYVVRYPEESPRFFRNGIESRGLKEDRQ